MNRNRLHSKKTHRNIFKNISNKNKKLPMNNNETKSNPYLKELRKLKNKQIKTNSKLDYIIEHIKLKKQNDFKIIKFNFEYVQKNNSNHYDYFSFKIKPDHLKTTLEYKERDSINSGLKMLKKTNSPDNLINHKFFEDIDHFDNFRNLMNVKTIEFTNNAANPFSTSIIINNSPHFSKKSSKRNSISSDKNEIKPEISSLKDEGELSLVGNFSEIEEKVNNVNNQNTIEKSLNSEMYNESASSSKYICNSSISQDRFKKVRGFNFKNNINTKKFIKPFTNIQKNSTDEVSLKELNKTNNELEDNEVPHIKKSEEVQNKKENVEKIKKFNFNNNINIKKFIRTESKELSIDIEEKSDNK